MGSVGGNVLHYITNRMLSFRPNLILLLLHHKSSSHVTVTPGGKSRGAWRRVKGQIPANASWSRDCSKLPKDMSLLQTVIDQ
mmetsp:Transcript_62304/g.73800  ORF Transcript_62304/g.73800 Transcript_62304/m.73800 type:complete len:82 (-) Transcript_62304:36-281(-)